MTAKYAIGIDLGTTNSVVAYAALDGDRPTVQVLPIPQLSGPGTIEEHRSLPSFLYLASSFESTAGTFDLPWRSGDAFAVGRWARDRSAEVPDRTVSAAKSWLGHSRVDRHEPILPWEAPDDVTKLSPVTASRRYLEHLVAAWEHRFPDAPIAQQQVILTVPASFDAAARDLTREAAATAGLPADLILLEEPQAALYAWLDRQGDRWRRQLQVGDRLMVCDVGGGTTDLTLIEVDQQEGELALRRQAVGNHLLVGGDNMDLALAYYAAQRFEEQGLKLDPWQSISLWHACRQAKERLLGSEPPASHPITVVKRGRSLVGGSATIELDGATAANLLLDGFFPLCEANDKPQRLMASGFQELGLPYEADTAITRHVAAFLARHADEHGAARPTHLLFNGGVFKAPGLRQRMVEALGRWRSGEAPKLLDGNDDLDEAVACGAAYYGWSKRRGGIRIRGGTARSYYVGIEKAGLAIPGAPRPLRALCVVPFGMEEGTEADVPSNEIGLIVGHPAKFRFFSSPHRKLDAVGTTLDRWEEGDIDETDSLETTLSGEGLTDDSFLPVRFRSRITELGTFELWCVGTRTPGEWKLEFDVRDDAVGERG